MTFFKDFPRISYDFTIRSDDGDIVEYITDLSQRVQLKISAADLARLCDDYTIVAGTKPEQIAYNLYGNPLLHWTILYVNGIHDIHGDWPMNESDLSKFVTKKYGDGNEYATHHNEKMPEQIWMDGDF